MSGSSESEWTAFQGKVSWEPRVQQVRHGLGRCSLWAQSHGTWTRRAERVRWRQSTSDSSPVVIAEGDEAHPRSGLQGTAFLQCSSDPNKCKNCSLEPALEPACWGCMGGSHRWGFSQQFVHNLAWSQKSDPSSHACTVSVRHWEQAGRPGQRGKRLQRRIPGEGWFQVIRQGNFWCTWGTDKLFQSGELHSAWQGKISGSCFMTCEH